MKLIERIATAIDNALLRNSDNWEPKIDLRKYPEMIRFVKNPTPAQMQNYTLGMMEK